jgi:hypothetical protein
MAAPDSEKSTGHLRSIRTKLESLVLRKNKLIASFKKRLEEKEIEELQAKLKNTRDTTYES